jgi:quercetin dioxygenase-like cupin family protein
MSLLALAPMLWGPRICDRDLKTYEEGKLMETTNVYKLEEVMAMSERTLPGGPERFFDSLSMTIFLRIFDPGEETTVHYHGESDNVIVVLEGEGTFTLDQGKSMILGLHSFLKVPKGTVHHIKNNSNRRLINLHIYSPRLHEAVRVQEET